MDNRALIRKTTSAKRESRSVEFKEKFDTSNNGEWLEIIKDFCAIANSGGGVIIVGVKNNGAPSGIDISDVLRLDGAMIADKLHKYIGEHFDGFEILEVRRGRSNAAAIIVSAKEESPIVFAKPGTYVTSRDRQERAFSQGIAYFRHSSKSEPGTANDHRLFIERCIDSVRQEWLGGIRKVVTAPKGIEIVHVHEVDETGSPVRVQLTNDPDARMYGRLDHDQTHPHRMKELLAELHKRLGRRVSEFDVRCLRQARKIDEKTKPDFCVKPRYYPMQYSDAFIDWIASEAKKNPKLFDIARIQYRRVAKIGKKL